MLLQKFEPFFDLYTFMDGTRIIRPKKLDRDGNVCGTRKRDMSAVVCLGLVLMWFRTRRSCARALAMIFRQTSTPMYKWLKFVRRVLMFYLLKDPDARISLPIVRDVKNYQDAIGAKYLEVKEVWAAADGLKLWVKKPGNYIIQNMFYNG